jgi:SH3-like domain-containing protein
MNNKLVKSFLIAFFCVIIPFSANALMQHLTVNAQGDLHLTVFITDSPFLLYGWKNTPPSHALNINTIAETKFNQQAYAGFAITGFSKDADSKVNLVVGVQVFKPDGSVVFRGENWAVYTKEVSIDKGIIIPEPLLEIRAESTDPVGNYKISATVTDKISDKKTTSSVILKIKPDNALPLQKEDNRPHTSVSSKGMTAGEETPPQKLDQSDERPEQVVPQASTVDEAATPVEKEDEPEPKVMSQQNFETTKAVEYARISVGANIRSDASLSSEVLHTVPPGYPVAVLERQTDWLLVEDYRGRKGWVFASLVKEPKTLIIKAFKGNLRSGPSLMDDIIVQLDHGKIMPVLERSGEWLKVSDFEGLTGWLHFKVIWPALEMNE